MRFLFSMFTGQPSLEGAACSARGYVLLVAAANDGPACTAASAVLVLALAPVLDVGSRKSGADIAHCPIFG